MVKILSQAGNSLADIYDVEGSVAGIDQLETSELPIVHEMGATVLSERLSGNIRRQSTGAIAQSTAWDIEITNFPSGIWRVLGIQVLTDAGRVNFAQVSLRDPRDQREIPLWFFDSTNDQVDDIRIEDNAGGAGNTFMLVPINKGSMGLPSMAIGTGQPQRVGDIAFRGLTTAFGAGDVTVVALIHIAFSQVGGLGGIDNRGLPVPSW